jgi:hypothetical protein
MGSRCSQAFSRVSYQIPQNHHQVHKQTAARHAKDAAAVLQEHDAERNPRAARAPLHNQQPQHNRDRERTERMGYTREGEADRRTEESIASRCPLTSSPPIKPPPDSRPNSRRNARTQGRNRASTGRSSAGSKTPPEKSERKTQRTSRTRDEQHTTPTITTQTHMDGSIRAEQARARGGARGFWKGKGRRLGLKPQWLPTSEELGAGGGSNPVPHPASVRPCQKGVCLKKRRQRKEEEIGGGTRTISPPPFAQLGRQKNPTRKAREENAAHHKNTRRIAHHHQQQHRRTWMIRSEQSKQERWSKGILERMGKAEKGRGDWGRNEDDLTFTVRSAAAEEPRSESGCSVLCMQQISPSTFACRQAPHLHRPTLIRRSPKTRPGAPLPQRVPRFARRPTARGSPRVRIRCRCN